MSDTALREAHAEGQASYSPEAWAAIAAATAARQNAREASQDSSAPEQLAPKHSKRRPLLQRFLDARWPVVVNDLFWLAVLLYVSRDLKLISSVGFRLLTLVVYLLVVGVALVGSWRRWRVVEGLLAVCWGYLGAKGLRDIFTGYYAAATGSLVGAVQIPLALVMLLLLPVYFGGRALRRRRGKDGGA